MPHNATSGSDNCAACHVLCSAAWQVSEGEGDGVERVSGFPCLSCARFSLCASHVRFFSTPAPSPLDASHAA